MTRPARDATERKRRVVPMPPNTVVINLDGDLSPGQIRARALFGLRESKRRNAAPNSWPQHLADNDFAAPDHKPTRRKPK